MEGGEKGRCLCPNPSFISGNYALHLGKYTLARILCTPHLFGVIPRRHHDVITPLGTLRVSDLGGVGGIYYYIKLTSMAS